MPVIQTAEDAVEIAERFLGRYHYFRKLLRVKQEDNTWLVEFDVGVLKTEIVHIRLDSVSSKVLEYTTQELQ